ncbi:MAG: MFS transporter [Gammaproteobacteria bacterium]|nr:MFS transporter [Gammaproteobacteria bacterium]
MPYWRLSAFYLFYFASLGALVPYWGLYLQSLDFSPQDIGLFMAIIMGTKIVSPNIWGWVADHTGKSIVIVRLGCLLAAITFAGVFMGTGYWWLIGTMVLFSFFWNAVLPQFEVTTFNYLGESSHRYSRIRLWGSVGFVLTVAGLGPLLGVLGVQILPLILMILFVGIWLASLLVSESTSKHEASEKVSLYRIIMRPTVFVLLLTCFLMQVSHGPYYTFYTIHMENQGYSRGFIGQLWAFGVIAEVVAFLLMHRLVPVFGLRNLLLASLLLTGLRWFVVAYYVDSIEMMVFAQLLHAASFGVYHACAIQLIHQYFAGRNQGKGQALYSSLSFGAGGAVGSLYSGAIWENMGASFTFVVAAITALVAFFLSWVWIRPENDRPKVC